MNLWSFSCWSNSKISLCTFLSSFPATTVTFASALSKWLILDKATSPDPITRQCLFWTCHASRSEAFGLDKPDDDINFTRFQSEYRRKRPANLIVEFESSTVNIIRLGHVKFSNRTIKAEPSSNNFLTTRGCRRTVWSADEFKQSVHLDCSSLLSLAGICYSQGEETGRNTFPRILVRKSDQDVNDKFGSHFLQQIKGFRVYLRRTRTSLKGGSLVPVIAKCHYITLGNIT